MANIKVLTFGWEFAPIVSGGLGIVCRDLSEHLSQKGVDITFVLPKLPQKVDVNFLNLVNASDVEVSNDLIKYIGVSSHLLPYSSAHNYAETVKALKRRLNLSSESPVYGLNLFEEMEKVFL